MIREWVYDGMTAWAAWGDTGWSAVVVIEVNRTKVKVVKNKVAPPFKLAEFDIIYGEGISRTGDLLDLVARACVIERNRALGARDRHALRPTELSEVRVSIQQTEALSSTRLRRLQEIAFSTARLRLRLFEATVAADSPRT